MRADGTCGVRPGVVSRPVLHERVSLGDAWQRLATVVVEGRLGGAGVRVTADIQTDVFLVQCHRLLDFMVLAIHH